jgi:phosphate-selective porin
MMRFRLVASLCATLSFHGAYAAEEEPQSPAVALPSPSDVAPPPAVAPATPEPALRVEAGPPDRARSDTVGVEGTEGEAAPSEAGARRLLVGDDADLRIRVRVQPRLDYGDLLVSRDGRTFDTSRDIYLRRVRASLTGTVLSRFHYVLTLDGDRVSQNGRPNQVSVTDAAVDFRVADALVIRAGRAKLPFTRIGLTSSARQLLVDRPIFIDAARGLFTDVNQANLLVRGRLLDGAIAYYGAVADGWSSGAQIYSSGTDRPAVTVRDSGILWVARLELSPPGLAESHKSDSHIGSGYHLTIGGNLVSQQNIAYAEVDGHEDRHFASVDVSGHLGPLTAQSEVSWSEISSTVTARGTIRPHGWYAQLAMYVAPLHLEPAVRYELDVEDATRTGAQQEAYTIGLNAYVMRHALKFQLAFVHRIFENASSQRLPGTDSANVGQVQMQMYL